MTTDGSLKAKLEASLGMGATGVHPPESPLYGTGPGGAKDRAVETEAPTPTGFTKLEFGPGGEIYAIKLAWPTPGSLIHVQYGKHRYYRFTDGSGPDLVDSTTAIKAALGLSKEPLVAWAAKVEREACLEALITEYATGRLYDGPRDLAARVAARCPDGGTLAWVMEWNLEVWND